MISKNWWRSAVIYQIYPRSYRDSSGDGIGDLPGIIEKLSYLKSLGVDGIWISPFFKSPMKDFGYDVADYRLVDPMFGTNADFKNLLDLAHDLGIRVVIDLVLSHTSDQHPWFQTSRQSRTNEKADWYVWADPMADGSPPNNWLSIFGGSAWQWDPRRSQYYLHNFLKEQPDLNLHSKAVQEELLSVIKYWCDFGVDGFRLDVINFLAHDPMLRSNPPRPQGTAVAGTHQSNPYAFQHHLYDKSQPEALEFLQRFRHLVDQYDDKFLMGEIVCDHGLKTIDTYTGREALLHSAYSFEFFERPFTPTIVKEVVEEYFAKVKGGSPSWAFSNHDVPRVVSRWFPEQATNPEVAKCALALLLSLPGQVLVYQGEELGFTQSDVPLELMQDPYGIEFYPNYKGRDGCRTPMAWTPKGDFSHGKPWLPLDLHHLNISQSAQEGNALAPLAFARSMILWRKGHIGTSLKLKFEDHQSLVLMRYEHGSFIVVNPTPKAEKLDFRQVPDQIDISQNFDVANSTLGPFGFLIGRANSVS